MGRGQRGDGEGRGQLVQLRHWGGWSRGPWLAAPCVVIPGARDLPLISLNQSLSYLTCLDPSEVGLGWVGRQRPRWGRSLLELSGPTQTLDKHQKLHTHSTKGGGRHRANSQGNPSGVAWFLSFVSQGGTVTSGEVESWQGTLVMDTGGAEGRAGASPEATLLGWPLSHTVCSFPVAGRLWVPSVFVPSPFFSQILYSGRR